MSLDLYTLDENNVPVPAEDLHAWIRWDEENVHRRVVARTEFGDGGVVVSTAFFGLDVVPNGDPPMLFETMIFGGPMDSYRQRYWTWEDAQAGHFDLVAKLTGQRDAALD